MSIYRSEKEPTEDLIFVCECHNIEHHLYFLAWDDAICLDVQMKKNTFFGRLCIAVRYLFKGLSPSGSEVILYKENALKLAKALEDYFSKVTNG